MSTRKSAKTKYLIHDSDKIILGNHPSMGPFLPAVLSEVFSSEVWAQSDFAWMQYTRHKKGRNPWSRYTLNRPNQAKNSLHTTLLAWTLWIRCPDKKPRENVFFSELLLYEPSDWGNTAEKQKQTKWGIKYNKQTEKRGSGKAGKLFRQICYEDTGLLEPILNTSQDNGLDTRRSFVFVF